MKKQGFTLIELMIVIVIMGILAAVAVPKLFGQIAKAKASEVATNASAFKTALDAFAMTENKVGDAAAIGYSLPKEEIFAYTITASGATSIWLAESKVGLNECKSGSTWTLTGTYTSSTGKVAYTQAVVDANSGSGCKELTPGFEKLGDIVPSNPNDE